MHTHAKAIVVATTTLAICCAPAGAALIINLNGLNNFTAAQQTVITQARTDWLALLTFNGGDHTIRINLASDNTITDLGVTGGWVVDGNGRVTSVNVTINTNAHNWTLGAPLAGADDALDTLRHELCHAIGWTVACGNFAANVTTVAGNRFYDLDSSGAFNAGDFDLIDDAGMGTHAPAGSGDLMQPSTPQGTRNAPTMQHAQVLADAFGFRVIPAPAGLAVLGFLLVGSRRRRSAASADTALCRSPV